MTAFRNLVLCAATVAWSLNVAAQDPSPLALVKLLPRGAKIIETADLKVAPNKPRQLVLWMQTPQKFLRNTDHPGEVYCGDAVYGDHWYGPTRLSLVDPAKHELLNTLEIRDFFEHADDDEHGFPVPFFVPNDFYRVPSPNSQKEGTPRILNLSDLTGEGYAGQFALFEHEVCGTALTSVFGYSQMYDRAVQYRVEVLRGTDTPGFDTWVPAIFGRKPVRPGYWKFTWEPGHGANATIDEEVSFDRARQLFIDEQTVTPHP